MIVITIVIIVVVVADVVIVVAVVVSFEVPKDLSHRLHHHDLPAKEFSGRAPAQISLVALLSLQARHGLWSRCQSQRF